MRKQLGQGRGQAAVGGGARGMGGDGYLGVLE